MGGCHGKFDTRKGGGVSERVIISGVPMYLGCMQLCTCENTCSVLVDSEQNVNNKNAMKTHR